MDETFAVQPTITSGKVPQMNEIESLRCSSSSSVNNKRLINDGDEGS